MIVAFGIIAIILLIAGHIVKTMRWAQIVGAYETLDHRELLKILSISHAVNVLLPFRVGDFVRIGMSAKKMKNGYSLAIATVISDLYLDIITVSGLFFCLSISGYGNEALKAVAHGYVVIFIVLLVCTIVGVFYRKRIKKIIRKVASVFNEKIEMQILFLLYTTIASFKDIIYRLNKRRLLLYTAGMWMAYFASYAVFSRFLIQCGMNYDTQDVFSFIFSENCTTLLLFSRESGLADSSFIFSIMLYMLIPLGAIWVVLRVAEHKKKMSNKEVHSFYILPHLNQNDKLAFLETYFSSESNENINQFLDMNRDNIILDDLSAGSNATTILCMDSTNEIFYRKYAFGREAIKLQEQKQWIEEHKNVLPLPVIKSVRQGIDYFAYDMQYDIETMSLFQYIHLMPKEAGLEVLRKTVEILEIALYNCNKRIASSDEIENYIENKVNRNIEIIQSGGKYIKQLSEYNDLVINGNTYRNLRYYEQVLSLKNLKSVFINDCVSDIHGDLTIENIVCRKTGGADSFYLIDPNTGNQLNTPFLDYAKLLQSLHGSYEFLMLVKDVTIKNNEIGFMYTKSEKYSYLQQKYDEILRSNFNEQEIKSIYFHEIVHWIRLLPYKIRKDEKLAVVFYCGLLMVMDDVVKRFSE